MELRKLEQIIEVKKDELFKLVSNYGFQHQKVLEVSQELDKLINWFMLLK
ncbi:aspartyl-phosphate phosphatase Spo0E family protein [Bacillus gaemokensis]|uniref:Stage 0 sporulation regulatory protein n=1 Tax=Bacillus gaemokensis TaxID=574375 RepID=A0A073K877_9BACI|nr:aspartyl-phosphate phosphatase Spo0E family protein [Bacillus gaemokensis]KEK23479.1 stage 0 sporulation regulatory protein [Bacillus gaemokensis]KYG27152.1 transcriptional regulator [Bacillus gaemokensis]